MSRSSSSSSSRSRSSGAAGRAAKSAANDLDDVLKLSTPSAASPNVADDSPREAGRNHSMVRASVCNRKLLQCHDEIAEKKTELEMRMREKVLWCRSSVPANLTSMNMTAKGSMSIASAS